MATTMGCCCSIPDDDAEQVRNAEQVQNSEEVRNDHIQGDDPNSNTPATPPTQPPPPTRSSDSSSSNSCCKDNVNALAEALVKAANKYIELDEAALKKGNNYDDFVEVELPDMEYPSMQQLREATFLAKSSARTTGKVELVVGKVELIVGKMKLVALPFSNQVFVRQVASGHKHGQAVLEVGEVIAVAARPFKNSEPEFVNVGTDGMYGSTLIAAPDVEVISAGLPPNGQEANDSESGPLYFAEVEDGNRSLPELVRHLGMLLVNFPRLNGVLGIKGMEDESGNRMNGLVALEWQRNAAGVRVGQPHVTNLIDFGPEAMSAVRRSNVEQVLQLPLPPLDTRPVANTHGADVAPPLPGWTRYGNGFSAPGQAAIIEIPPAVLFGGAFSRTEGGVAGAIIDIPVNAIPASISLRLLVRRYWGAQ